MNFVSLGIFASAFVLSWAGVALFRRWSHHREIFDVPNERSSHTVPTPRGGGIVIVIVTLAAYVLAATITPMRLSWGYLAGAIIIAVVSWLDDLLSIPFWARLLVHIIGAALLIADVGYWQSVFFPVVDWTLPLGPVVGLIVTMGWLVWLINAYNFMDGIDGIASLQAITAGAGWAVLAAALSLDGIFIFAGALACATVGFLLHNWEPARIFMGDVGSAFLGFTLAALPLLAASTPGIEVSHVFPVVGVLFLWFFVFDGGFTLVTRLLQRQRVWEAHRQHLYQKMIISGWRHSSVSLVYGIFGALLSTSVVTGLLFSGYFHFLSLSALIISTLALVYLGFRKTS